MVEAVHSISIQVWARTGQTQTLNHRNEDTVKDTRNQQKTQRIYVFNQFTVTSQLQMIKNKGIS